MAVTILKSELPSTEIDISDLKDTVASILAHVEREGDIALRHYALKFDGRAPESFRVTPQQAAAAASELPSEVIEELDFAIEQVTAFAKAQRASLSDLETEIAPGTKVGHRLVPVASCGCYVPAGRYPCLTSAVMTVVPAKVAGVRRIVACSPPGRDGSINRGILYTMYRMGVDEIYCFGGAQAIAAFAYGTDTITPVDLIVGPGNRFVTEAKRQVFGRVGIDFLAGPSECVVIADESGNPDVIAADLLAQCEHDPNARGALVTTSPALARRTMTEIERQLSERTTAETAGASWSRHGLVAVADTLDEAVAYVNDYAPEHLELHVSDPRDLMPQLENYGSLFLGEMTAEVFADKIAGPNHVLPTGGAARYTGGLWVGMYLKAVSHMETDRAASLKLARFAETQAHFEGMDAHRFAASIRIARFSAEG